MAKVDLILDARPCNTYIRSNKEALDFLRVFIPGIKDMQDMNAVLLKARQSGHDHFGKFDMLNAYAQIPLPRELRPFTMFRVDQKIYRFKTLPFGLSVSSHVFTIYLAIHLFSAKGRFLQ